MEDMEMREKVHKSLEKRSPRKRTGAQYLMLADAIEVSGIVSSVLSYPC